MRQLIGNIAKKTPFYEFIARVRDLNAYRKWISSGRALATPHVAKAQLILEAAQNSETLTFVETGTYFGAMIEAVRTHFDRLVTIELDPALHRRAKKRFYRDKRVTCLAGDSGVVLEEVLRTLHGPALFWLDAHYSGGVTARGSIDSPVVSELRSVLSHRFAQRHAILIDDARCFDGTAGYPTLARVQSLLQELGSKHSLDVIHDVIRILPA
jgi:hypothetical protein